MRLRKVYITCCYNKDCFHVWFNGVWFHESQENDNKCCREFFRQVVFFSLCDPWSRSQGHRPTFGMIELPYAKKKSRRLSAKPIFFSGWCSTTN